MTRRISAAFAGLLALSLAAPPPVLAQGQPRISFIRDAEVENTIRAYATPLFAAAGLEPNAIRVHLVNDRSLNAFVANGLNMFINTGLLVRADHPGQVIGVIAHETGHITGGHLARFRDGMRGALAETIVAMVAGIAAAVATGNAGAGAAVIAGGLQAAERGLLRYSREMERSADQAGVNLLERTGQSAKGLAEFLDILADQELITIGRQDPYVRTHPITRERIDFVHDQLSRSRFAATPPRPEYDLLHRRMRAKLLGYLEPARALQVYRESDTSLESRYARAIAHSRRPDYPRALALMDSLLAEKPGDGYFLEAKGQMLFEMGKPAEALPYYERAVLALPNEPLIRTSLGQVQIEMNRPELIQAGIANLETSTRQDPDSSETWRLLSIGYGRDNNLAMAALAQAERAMLQGRRAEARSFAERAERQLPAGSAAWLRAQDLRRSAEIRN